MYSYYEPFQSTFLPKLLSIIKVHRYSLIANEILISSKAKPMLTNYHPNSSVKNSFRQPVKLINALQICQRVT